MIRHLIFTTKNLRCKPRASGDDPLTTYDTEGEE